MTPNIKPVAVILQLPDLNSYSRTIEFLSHILPGVEGLGVAV